MNTALLALNVTGWLALLGAFVLLIVLYRRLEGQSGAGTPAQNEQANMAIMLQTMRDVLEQQKALARSFNKGLEGKIDIVRKVVRAVLEEHEHLENAHRELAAMREKTKGDLVRVQQLLIALRKKASENPAAVAAPETPPEKKETESREPVLSSTPSPAPAVAPSAPGKERPALASAPAPPEPQAPMPEPPPVLQALAKPEARTKDALPDYWAGIDLSELNEDEDKSLYTFDVPEEVPEEPEDPETAREAFRKLLDMTRGPARAKAKTGEQAGEAKSGGNGRDRAETVQNRVYRFSDAGMSVTEIAQELGLGKAEVRLMLNLREKRSE